MFPRIKPHRLYFLFWLISVAVYYRTAGAGFVFDTIGWFETYQKLGWGGVSIAFGDRSLHFIYHFISFLLYKIFGFNGWGWMLTFASLHSVAAYLGFILFSKIFDHTGISHPKAIAVAGSLLFLLSPYQTEPLVWYACIHYPVCVILLMLSFMAFLRFLENGQGKKYIFLFYTCFILSVFTLEIGFCFPLIIAGLIWLFPLKNFGHFNRWRLTGIYVIPAVAAVAGYFILSKFLRGSFAGHYGAEAHFNFDIVLLVSNFSKYCAKLFGFLQFLPHEKRSVIYLFFEKELWCYSFLSVSLGLIISVVLFSGRWNRKFILSVFLFAAFALAIGPTINLYFTSIVPVEGDRFTYFGSLFAYQFLSFLCVVFLRWAGGIILAGYLILSCYFLNQNIVSWQSNREINRGLIESFKYYDAPHIFFLNMPDNFGGTYLFRSFNSDNALAEAIAVRTGKDIEYKCTNILQYNMNSSFDSVTIEKISDSELKVIFAQPGGNWWWREGKGASDYSTESYTVKIDEWMHAYTITFKSKIPGAVYLYQCGNEWRRLENF